MGRKAAITINRPREDVERLWQSSEYRVTFADAPGDRGTEIHVDVGDSGLAQRLRGSARRAKAMDELRRFKQQIETGVIARSESSPQGELAERKLKQRPAQPLTDAEAHEVGVR